MSAVLVLLLWAAWLTIGLLGIAAIVGAAVDEHPAVIAFLFFTIVWFGLPVAVFA